MDEDDCDCEEEVFIDDDDYVDDDSYQVGYDDACRDIEDGVFDDDDE